MKTLELKTTGFVELNEPDSIETAGGSTSFVYDLATALRANFQATTGNVNGLVKTAFTWFAQQ
ncbi:hypothetical protein [Sediminibacterium soli]|uniref:hypothetical protein n=1 Tax=Sediminibacterium soli TaxID=2698829 RepID=UPI00137A7528|nr:hypothetical protein [Sediminibacterium soli]NCI47051.1 hypothetical protein [Sediminibacterium soli]